MPRFPLPGAHRPLTPTEQAFVDAMVADYPNPDAHRHAAGYTVAAINDALARDAAHHARVEARRRELAR